MSGSFEIYDKNTIVIDDITNDIFTEIIKYNKISINQYTKEYYTLYPIRDRDDLSDKNKIKLCGGFNRCIDALSNFDNITHIIFKFKL